MKSNFVLDLTSTTTPEHTNPKIPKDKVAAKVHPQAASFEKSLPSSSSCKWGDSVSVD